MTLDEFILMAQERDFESLSQALQALWYDSKGDWHKAHQIVQDARDDNSAWVHAYLHRKEGDISNARYWYRRTKRLESEENLQQEWQQIVTELLKQI